MIDEVVIPRNNGRSFIIKRGQTIRISAESIVALVCFNLSNLRAGRGLTKPGQRRINVKYE